MTEQPKEYIITGDEIDEIEKRFNDLIEKGTIPREEDCSNTLDNIRSHPVSTPPEGAAPEQMPTVTTNDVEHRKPRLGPDGSTSAPDREGSRHVSRNCGEHDAAIRQDERGEVLKDAEQRFRDIGMSATHEAVVLQVLNSLRQHKGEP